MSDATTTPAQQDLLLKARQAALLRQFVTAKRLLRPSELDELEGILPEKVLRRQRLRRGGDYERPYSHYATIYHRSERIIKRWVSRGRKAVPPELPPFDEPKRMKDWFLRHFGQRVPDDLLEQAAASGDASLSAESKPPADPLFAAAPPASQPPPTTPAAGPATAANSYASTLERLQDAESEAGRKYTELLRAAGTDEGRLAEAEQAKRAWLSIVKELRAYERDADEVMRARGDLWPRPAVLAATAEIHAGIRGGILGLLRRVRPKLSGLSPAEQDVLWMAEVESLFAGLRANPYTSPFADTARAA